jgi:hypothetical protein
MSLEKKMRTPEGTRAASTAVGKSGWPMSRTIRPRSDGEGAPKRNSILRGTRLESNTATATHPGSRALIPLVEHAGAAPARHVRSIEKHLDPSSENSAAPAHG